jgi:nucleoid-associated protein YgaU
MPRDYKIGIAIGLLVVIAGVAYFVVTGGGDDPQPNPQPAQQEKSNQVTYTHPDSGMPETTIPLDELPEPPADPDEDELAVAVVRAERDADEEENSGTVSIGIDSSPRPTVVRAAPPSEGVDPGVDPAAAAEGAFGEAESVGGFELHDDADEALAASDPEPVELATIRAEPPAGSSDSMTPSWRTPERTPRETEMAPVRPDRATARTVSPISPPPAGPPTISGMSAASTYKVTEDDTSGFWGISKKVYGTSKHFGLIEKANPNVDPRRLRPGTTLRIPPKPVETATTNPTQSPTQQGGFSTNAAGQRVYTVGPDDTGGLWGIAVKAYGKGHLNELIAKANPNVDSNRLNPGDTLIIPSAPPEQPVRSPAVSTALQSARAQEGQTIMENGKRYYVMASADNGFWTAAKKAYGDGKYMYVIAQANPGLDPVLLQPGDKVYVPPLPPESQRRPAAPVSSGGGGIVAEPVRRSGGLPEPDFGP